MSFNPASSRSDIDTRLVKNENLDRLREFNAHLITDLGISRTDFKAKMPFFANGRRVVGVFESEFRQEKGLYFELTNQLNEPSDPDRTVYRVSPSMYFKEEYEQSMYHKDSYLVPVEELQIVNRKSAAISKYNAVESSDRIFSAIKEKIKEDQTASKPPTESTSLADSMFSEMTVRDFAAIFYKKPVSNKAWLTELIKTV